MLNNLRAEYVRKNIDPYAGVMEALGVSERTARNKLAGKTPITVPEALKIIKTHFPEDGFRIEFLFDDFKTSATA